MSTLLALLPLLFLGPGDDWPRFRGESGNGVLAERRFPDAWGPEENLAWSVPVPGAGWSSPVVVGSRVFLTTAVASDGSGPVGFAGGVSDPSTMGRGDKPSGQLAFQLHCLRLEDGEPLWRREVGARVPEFAVHASNTYATESPASDGERVFVTFGALGEVVAYDLEGEQQWRVETGVFPTGNDFGWGISLAVDSGLVLYQNDNEESSMLLALDAASGEERWHVERDLGSSWGTPVLWSPAGRAQLVTFGRDRVIGYAPASGEELWRLQGVGGSFSSSPGFDAERMYFGNSGPRSRGPLVAIPKDLEGTLELEGLGEVPGAWVEERAGPGFASPVSSGDFVYVLASGGILAMHDARSGERVWRERLPDASTVVASPWIAGDELFILDENGSTFVVKVGAEFELLRTNTLDGLYWSTPSVAGDALLLRASDRLHCIRR